MRDGRIEYLIRLVEKSDIAELEITEGLGRKIRIAKYGSLVPHAPSVLPPTDASNPIAGSPAEASSDETAGIDDHLTKVVAPMVGTFYRASAADAQPFVEVGAQVE